MFAPYSYRETDMKRCVRGRGRPDAGLSLVELMIAIVVIAIALIALVSLIVSSSQVQQEAREKTLAYNAARRQIEVMRSTSFLSIFAAYRAGGTQGNTFAVEGLIPVSPDTAAGKIDFPLTGANLSENPSDTALAAQLGMPKDLNRDGDTTDTDVSSTSPVQYKILPVRIRVRWLGVAKKQTTIEVTSFITDK